MLLLRCLVVIGLALCGRDEEFGVVFSVTGEVLVEGEVFVEEELLVGSLLFVGELFVFVSS